MKIVSGGREKKSEILGGPVEGCPVEGCPAEGRSSGRVGFGFQVQFRFWGTKTEIEQKQNEERDE